MKRFLVALLIAAAFVWLLHDISANGFNTPSDDNCPGTYASAAWC